MTNKFTLIAAKNKKTVFGVAAANSFDVGKYPHHHSSCGGFKGGVNVKNSLPGMEL